MKTHLHIIALMTALSILTGCGSSSSGSESGSSSSSQGSSQSSVSFSSVSSSQSSVATSHSSSSSTPQEISGKFIDDPVSGLSYECTPSGRRAATDVDGTFTCFEGDSVSFIIGGVSLGPVAITEEPVTPYTLFPGDPQAALNLARLLQSLDNNPYDSVIDLNTTQLEMIATDVDFSSDAFASTVETTLGITLVSEADAAAQMDEAIAQGSTLQPDELIFHGLRYKKIVSSQSGRVWLDRNLGAKRQCLSASDTECFGHYFQWGRPDDGHQIVSYTDQTVVLSHDFRSPETRKLIIPLDPDATTGMLYGPDWTTDDPFGTGRSAFWSSDGGICPDGFRVPTYEELDQDYYFLKNSPNSLPDSGVKNTERTDNPVDTEGDYADPYLWTTDTRVYDGSLANDANDFTEGRKYPIAVARGPVHILAWKGLPVRCINVSQAPVADPGVSRTVLQSEAFTLDGSASYDADGSITVYEWREGELVLSNAVSFVPVGLSLGQHRITLRVTDDQNLSSETAINVRIVESLPDPIAMMHPLTGETYSYNVVVSPFTGKRWLDRNLGASEACSAEDDVACYGGYYQWGRSTDGHELFDSPTEDATVVSVEITYYKFILALADHRFDWTEVDGAGTQRQYRWSLGDGSLLCPQGYRVPTLFELAAETSESLDAVAGAAEMFTNFLNIPAAGYRGGDGEVRGAGVVGSLWSVTTFNDDNKSGSLAFDISTTYRYDADDRAKGHSVRCTDTRRGPEAMISGPGDAFPGESLLFDGELLSTALESSIVGYAWYIDGAPVSTEARFTVATLSSGRHSVELVVTDDNGLQGYAKKSVLIASQQAEINEVTLTHEGVSYQTVVLDDGTIWLDRNLGAENPCSTPDDSGCYGYYYQWGRGTDGHQLPGSNGTETRESDITGTGTNFVDVSEEPMDWTTADSDGALRRELWGSTDGRSVCPSGFRVPTYTELTRLGFENRLDGFHSALKLPYAGVRYDSASMSGVGVYTIMSSRNNGLKLLLTESEQSQYFEQSNRDKVSAAPIRCLFDYESYGAPIAMAGPAVSAEVGESVTLNASRSLEGSAPIASYTWREDGTLLSDAMRFTKSDWKAGQHLVELEVTDTEGTASYDRVTVTVIGGEETITFNGVTYETVTSPYTGRVWLDRNLGASRICQSIDDSECFGDYYQWGRRHDGHQDPASATTDVQASDLATTGPEFIIPTSSRDDWASTIDADGTLRGAFWIRTDGTSICPADFRVPTLVELSAETVDQGMANRDDLYTGFLKLPTTNGRNVNGNVIQSGDGALWASGPNDKYDYYSNLLYFSASQVIATYGARGAGSPVRCIKKLGAE